MQKSAVLFGISNIFVRYYVIIRNEVSYMVIAVCDDDKKITDYIGSVINKKFGNQILIKSYNFLNDLETSIFKNEIPDAIIMDICVEKDNGIEMLRKIREQILTVPVIFITGYTEYCQDIFIDFNPWGLLTKPIDKDKLFYYIDKIINYYKFSKPSSVKISINGQDTFIDKSRIIYLESHKRKVTYHTDSENYEEYIKLDDAMKKFDSCFIRCHKGYAVNFKYIFKLFKSEIVLTTGEKIPVSRSHYENVKKLIFEHKASTIGL